MRGFLIALQFLTILPVKIKKEISASQVAGSMAYFPLVGSFMALLLYLVYRLASFFFPTPVACTLLLIAWIILTGGLHLDGLADTLDGLTGGKDKPKILGIMRDSHIGALGTIALFGVLLLKFSLIYSIPRGSMLSALISSLAFGRWAMVLSSYLFPYARREDTKSGSFVELVDSREFAWATLTLVAFGIFFAGFKFFILLPMALAALACFNLFLFKKIGGITGDTLGALNEIIEALILFGFVR